MHSAYVIFTQLWVFIFKLTALFGHRKAVPFFKMRRRALYSNLAVYTNSELGEVGLVSLRIPRRIRAGSTSDRSLHQIESVNSHLLTLFSPSAHTPLTTTRIPSWKRKGDLITALPVDTPRSIKRFLESGSYEFKFFASAKYEVWPELIKQLSAASIPLYVFAAHVVPDSIFTKRNLIGRFLSEFLVVAFARILKTPRLQNDFVSGIPATESGDSRADRVLQIAHSTSTPKFLEDWKGDSTVLRSWKLVER